jgi:hypothetical protein
MERPELRAQLHGTWLSMALGNQRTGIPVCTGTKSPWPPDCFHGGRHPRNTHRSLGRRSMWEHCNDLCDFRPMIQYRKGPDLCNTFNMAPVVEQLFTAQPPAAQADSNAPALYDHGLASTHPTVQAHVNSTDMRPGHCRAYSQPERCFPLVCEYRQGDTKGRYAPFVSARPSNGRYMNLSVPTETKLTALSLDVAHQRSCSAVLRLRRPNRVLNLGRAV